ncbi:hypothetical protein [Pseudomonas peli]|uniref:hypothetical protein n=1 Tax=Pseudomonas peli TaxID=592361 RepID=UPI003D159E01
MQAARSTLAGDALARQGLLNDLGRIVAVDSQREHAWFEGPSGRQGRAISWPEPEAAEVVAYLAFGTAPVEAAGCR